MVIAIAIAGIPAFARITRAVTLTIREEEYVTAVKALGAPGSYTMLRTVLPNALSPIIVQVVVAASVAVLLEAALSFLGLGTVPPEPSWGDMLRSAKSNLYQAPLYALFPGLLLTLTIVSLDLIGNGLQRLRGSSASADAALEGRG
jgi:ABC-type dipeptide/oligopeptide/nickel transport system permease subunit